MGNYFAENLKYLRESKRISKNKLGELVGVNQSTIGRWEDKEIKPSIDNVEEVAKALNVPLPDMLIKDLRFDNGEFVELSTDNVKIPVLGKIPAGIPFEAVEDQYAIDYEEIPRSWLNGGKQFFALKLDGDSMEPEYKDNDVVIFQKTTDCESGQDCCIKINGFDATFKRVKKQANGIMIIPLNENNSSGFSTTFYTNEDIVNMPVEIIGIVKQIRRNR